MILDGQATAGHGRLDRHSIAYSVAERAQEQGAEIVLTGFGRARRMTERAAKRLPEPPDVLELDVNDAEDLAALAKELGSRWARVDGAVHAIALAPADALGGQFVAAPRESATVAFETSAYSLQGARRRTGAADAQRERAAARSAIVGLDFDASVAWPAYDWMGVAKAALESVARYLARDLGADGTRVNLVSAGPISTPAASGIPGFDGWRACGTAAPRWDGTVPTRRPWPMR